MFQEKKMNYVCTFENVCYIYKLDRAGPVDNNPPSTRSTIMSKKNTIKITYDM